MRVKVTSCQTAFNKIVQHRPGTRKLSDFGSDKKAMSDAITRISNQQARNGTFLTPPAHKKSSKIMLAVL